MLADEMKPASSGTAKQYDIPIDQPFSAKWPSICVAWFGLNGLRKSMREAPDHLHERLLAVGLSVPPWSKKSKSSLAVISFIGTDGAAPTVMRPIHASNTSRGF